MLELGLSELFLVGIVALVVIGPHDLPKLFRVVGKYVGRAKEMARDFQRSFDEAAKESGLDTIRHNIENIKDFKPSKIVQNTISDDKKNADMLEEKPNRPFNNKNKSEHTDSKKKV